LLAVQLLALVPILGSLLLPREDRVPLTLVGGAPVVIGALMLLRRKPTPARVPRADVTPG
jgi:hypothetical protein